MLILGIDPGPTESAWVRWDSKTEAILDMMICHSDYLIEEIGRYPFDVLAVEHIQCQGMAVGKTVFETCYWIGEVRQWARTMAVKWFPVMRSDVKMHWCGSPRAKDPNIRQAIIDRFGAPGTKANKGKLYGVKRDLWSALAIAVYAGDMLNQ
jgi:hypothetical protein